MKSNLKSKLKSKSHKKIKGGDDGYVQNDRIECVYVDKDDNKGLYITIKNPSTKFTDDDFPTSRETLDIISIRDGMIINRIIESIRYYVFAIYTHILKERQELEAREGFQDMESNIFEFLYSNNYFNVNSDGSIITWVNESYNIFNSFVPPLYALFYNLEFYNYIVIRDIYNVLNNLSQLPIVSRLLIHYYYDTINTLLHKYFDNYYNIFTITYLIDVKIDNKSFHTIYNIYKIKYNKNTYKLTIYYYKDYEEYIETIDLTQLLNFTINFPFSLYLILHTFDNQYHIHCPDDKLLEYKEEEFKDLIIKQFIKYINNIDNSYFYTLNKYVSFINFIIQFQTATQQQIKNIDNIQKQIKEQDDLILTLVDNVFEDDDPNAEEYTRINIHNDNIRNEANKKIQNLKLELYKYNSINNFLRFIIYAIKKLFNTNDLDDIIHICINYKFLD